MYARRQFCADLEVYRPPEPLWNPRLREAATTCVGNVGENDAEKVSLRKQSTTRQHSEKNSRNVKIKYFCEKIDKYSVSLRREIFKKLKN